MNDLATELRLGASGSDCGRARGDAARAGQPRSRRIDASHDHDGGRCQGSSARPGNRLDRRPLARSLASRSRDLSAGAADGRSGVGLLRSRLGDQSGCGSARCDPRCRGLRARLRCRRHDARRRNGLALGMLARLVGRRSPGARRRRPFRARATQGGIVGSRLRAALPRLAPAATPPAAAVVARRMPRPVASRRSAPIWEPRGVRCRDLSQRTSC